MDEGFRSFLNNLATIILSLIGHSGPPSADDRRLKKERLTAKLELLRPGTPSSAGQPSGDHNAEKEDYVKLKVLAWSVVQIAEADDRDAQRHMQGEDAGEADDYLDGDQTEESQACRDRPPRPATWPAQQHRPDRRYDNRDPREGCVLSMNQERVVGS